VNAQLQPSARAPAVQDIASKIADRSAVIAVVGLGAVGGVTAELIAAAGFPTIGIDRSEARVSTLRSVLSGNNVQLTTDASALSRAHVIVIAVRVAASESGADLGALRAALRSVQQFARRPALLLIESTVPAGTTRELTTEFFGVGSQQSALTCHCPERLRVGDGIAALRATPRLVGGISCDSTALAVSFLEQLGIRGVATSGPEVTELAKLVENTFLTTGIALMGEITRIAHRLGVSAQEVATAAATKPHGYYPFLPGAGVGGHCLMNDLALLEQTARELLIDTPLLAGVHAAADSLTDTVVRKLEALLERNGRGLDGAAVCLVGVGFKPDCADTANTPALHLTRSLRARGAHVSYSDSLVETFQVDGHALERHCSPQSLEHVDALVLVSGDRTFDLEIARSRVRVILDAGGSRVMPAAARLASPL
jgi:nucleotide sugar dehydrogenase